jgi:spermidine/putrescine transport system ATP-binding protein
MAEQPLLRLQGLVKKFGEFTALDNVDLEIKEGEFFTIVGPSGSGKSTLIRLLVGMDDVSEGQILLRGERIDQTPANLAPYLHGFPISSSFSTYVGWAKY